MKNNRLITLFIFGIAELASISQVINALTGLDGLPALILVCLLTAIYTGEIFGQLEILDFH